MTPNGPNDRAPDPLVAALLAIGIVLMGIVAVLLCYLVYDEPKLLVMFGGFAALWYGCLRWLRRKDA